jgi:hypothetical protein
VKYEGHLKGPLTAGRPDMATIIQGRSGKYIYQGDKYVAAVGFDLDDWECVMATARLFAAAPEILKQRDALLEALKALQHPDKCYCEASFSGIGCHPRHSRECGQARAAIELCEKGDK